MTIELATGSVCFTQEADSCSEGIQALDVSMEDAGAGKFFVIKTDRWAFDKIEDLEAILAKVGAMFDHREST
ncbi:hypothetical protein [Zavarzinella formosa]|uniref:hypothetical protein n=1 Tax=Zavarzinella formosa TaxID=360055 RepID=UPI0003009DF8|nr:hypothetical protein [Zavarzinella formosa]